ncbi:glycosyltransferase family 4 protein [Cellulosimicrobium cellulans]|uniref:glycosyltransferase family 4 protein n=1 Tax=Cellulosimicrobium cellulans TaxID=1710 RepID=UPI0020969451|nr:glycosyltransferase family 4 protein [Cellulosimicrobium cellulans]MCO7274143.1 glycosyltransferase family 4 protein [Cellulosimicrobium cellulans]
MTDLRILQIAPEIAPGSGVGGVAHHLEEAFERAGVPTARFTLADARGTWLPEPGPGVRGRLVLLARVVWFSTVGTVLARRRVARERRASRGAGDAVVSICHNDVLAGDVYVNHGILRVAMRARGGYAWRMARNPLHLFTAARDALRYRGRAHRVVVNLTRSERDALRSTYPRLRARAVVIGNGVDVARFAPPTPAERAAARTAAGVPAGAVHVVFVGHEFDRKGLDLVLAAALDLPDVHVSVVGGTPDMLADVRARVARLGTAGRVHLAGRVPDPRPWLHAADALALPSAYEANALVVLEALACGVPVVATPVGYAPDVVEDGVTGWLVDRTVEGVRTGLAAVAALDDDERAEVSARARAAAVRHDWDAVARRYLELAAALATARSEPRP